MAGGTESTGVQLLTYHTTVQGPAFTGTKTSRPVSDLEARA